MRKRRSRRTKRKFKRFVPKKRRNKVIAVFLPVLIGPIILALILALLIPAVVVLVVLSPVFGGYGLAKKMPNVSLWVPAAIIGLVVLIVFLEAN